MATELKQLEAMVRRSRIFAAFVILLVVGGYIFNFVGFLGYEVSNRTETWGQFGDFVGGLLNPLLAYLAFYWLTQSTLIQKEELSSSQAALSEAASAQTIQATLNDRAAKLNALSTLVANSQHEINSLRSEVVYVQNQVTQATGNIFNRNGSPINPNDLPKYIADRQHDIVEAEVQRMSYLSQIHVLLLA